MAAERSASIPFLLKPVKLDGTLAGDKGFDPLGLSNIDEVGIGKFPFPDNCFFLRRAASCSTVVLGHPGVMYCDRPILAERG